ncbi:hypothetical protein [Streptomyces cylindrosporus]|uniref:Uncharacterized protein n=1 Tax=Streptomyces cylindrosporus TaxID=2927583 RepID=A0ABS9Y935_9ACTN|nr:hypothetical protein [Streptomyces cylindrosporus]MCI3273748.1 hypothetical protein [Streptomyces cylindrosporus]
MAAFLCRPVGVGTGAVTAPAAGDWTSTKPGIEAQKAFDVLEQRLPGTKGDEASARAGRRSSPCSARPPAGCRGRWTGCCR